MSQAALSGLSEVLGALTPTPAAYIKAARHIEAAGYPELRELRLGFLATFTAEILRPYLLVECAARGMLARPYFGPFNQLEQQALDPSSALFAWKPDVVVVASQLEDLSPVLTHRFLKLSSSAIEAELEQIEGRLRGLVGALRQNTTAAIMVFNLAPPASLAAGLADPHLGQSQVSAVQRANERIAETCRSFSGVYVFDYARLVCEVGIKRWSDAKLQRLGRIPFGMEAQMETSRRLARYFRALAFPPRKCLVVDLDNTLWGGVVGEDGLGGIALGEEFPGNVFKDFQRALLKLSDRGVLLAVASKNNLPDVLEVFQEHPDCLLEMEDFSAVQVHWGDKATSIKAIAEELNIGAEAIAFFDDSAVEREWVRSQLPEVAVIEAPDSPLGFVRAIEESGTFDYLLLSEEDRKRAELYRQEHSLNELQRTSISMEDFLKQLDVSASIGFVDASTLPRVAQLMVKTNQFNLATRRHSATELEKMSRSDQAVALWLRSSDRFGDNGLVGVAIALPWQNAKWLVDTFLMSCRVIGRGLETALLGVLAGLVRKRGGQVLLGEYVPTSKNGMVADFYPRHGFEEETRDGRLWKLDLTGDGVALPRNIKVTIHGGTTS